MIEKSILTLTWGGEQTIEAEDPQVHTEAIPPHKKDEPMATFSQVLVSVFSSHYDGTNPHRERHLVKTRNTCKITQSKISFYVDVSNILLLYLIKLKPKR